MRQRGLFPCPGGGRGGVCGVGACGRFVLRRPVPSRRGRKRWDGKGRDAPPVVLHLRHGQAPLKKNRAGARLSARRQVSLFVKVWPFSGGGRLRIVRSQLLAANSTILPRARQGKSAFADLRAPVVSKEQAVGRWSGGRRRRPPPLYPEQRRKSYAGRPERRTQLLRNAILAEMLPASHAASRLCGEAFPPEPNCGEDRSRPAAWRTRRGRVPTMRVAGREGHENGETQKRGQIFGLRKSAHKLRFSI